MTGMTGRERRKALYGPITMENKTMLWFRRSYNKIEGLMDREKLYIEASTAPLIARMKDDVRARHGPCDSEQLHELAVNSLKYAGGDPGMKKTIACASTGPGVRTKPGAVFRHRSVTQHKMAKWDRRAHHAREKTLALQRADSAAFAKVEQGDLRHDSRRGTSVASVAESYRAYRAVARDAARMYSSNKVTVCSLRAMAGRHHGVDMLKNAILSTVAEGRGQPTVKALSETVFAAGMWQISHTFKRHISTCPTTALQRAGDKIIAAGGAFFYIDEHYTSKRLVDPTACTIRSSRLTLGTPNCSCYCGSDLKHFAQSVELDGPLATYLGLPQPVPGGNNTYKVEQLVLLVLVPVCWRPSWISFDAQLGPQGSP